MRSHQNYKTTEIKETLVEGNDCTLDQVTKYQNPSQLLETDILAANKNLCKVDHKYL